MKTTKPQSNRVFLVEAPHDGACVRKPYEIRSVSEERIRLLDARASSEHLRSPLVAVLGGIIR